jgi:antitoxin VapB
MALNIKDPETERLAREVAAMTGESKTGAIRNALRERKERLVVQHAAGDRERVLRTLLEREVWPSLSPELLGSAPTAEEQDEFLGYGRDGV